MRVWVRRASAVAGVVLLAGLAGCSLRGEIHVVSRDEVRVDLRFEPDPRFGRSCVEYASGGVGLRYTPSDNPGDPWECRVVGTISAAVDNEEALRRIVMGADGLVALRTGPVGWSDSGKPLDVDVTVFFPGQVVDGNGQVGWTGTTMRWTDGSTAREHGMFALAEATPSPPRWLVPAVAGAGWGAVLVGLAAPSLRAAARRRDDSPADEPQPDRGPDATPDPPRAGPRTDTVDPPCVPAEDPSVWASDG